MYFIFNLVSPKRIVRKQVIIIINNINKEFSQNKDILFHVRKCYSKMTARHKVLVYQIEIFLIMK